MAWNFGLWSQIPVLINARFLLIELTESVLHDVEIARVDDQATTNVEACDTANFVLVLIEDA